MQTGASKVSWAFPGLLQAVNLYYKDADFSKINVWECRLFGKIVARSRYFALQKLVGMQTFLGKMSGNADECRLFIGK